VVTAAPDDLDWEGRNPAGHVESRAAQSPEMHIQGPEAKLMRFVQGGDAGDAGFSAELSLGKTDIQSVRIRRGAEREIESVWTGARLKFNWEKSLMGRASSPDF